MGTAAKVRIDLDAHTAALKRGFGETRREIRGLGASMSGKVAAGMAKFHAGLLAAKTVLGAVRAGIRAVTAAMQEMDRTAKMAARLGLTADALLALNFAAEQTGASSQTLQMALQRMTRRVSEAAQGSGEAVKALQELGLSAELLNRLGPDKQLGAIADAMRNVEGQSEKVRLAMKLFDSEGVALVNTLAGGSEGLNQMAKESANLGTILGARRKDVEAADDAIHAMSTTSKSLVKQIAADLAPAIEGAANMIKNIVAWMSKLYRVAIGPIINALSKAFKKINKIGWDILGRAKFEGSGVPEFTAKAAAGLKNVSDEIDKAKDKAAESAKKTADELAKRGKSLAQSLRTPVEVFRDSIAEMNKLYKAGAIRMETFRRGVAKEMETLDRATSVSREKEIPAIAATTRASMAGYSAVQEARRNRDAERSRHREHMARLERLEVAVRDTGIELRPVTF